MCLLHPERHTVVEKISRIIRENFQSNEQKVSCDRWVGCGRLRMADGEKVKVWKMRAFGIQGSVSSSCFRLSWISVSWDVEHRSLWDQHVSFIIDEAELIPSHWPYFLTRQPESSILELQNVLLVNSMHAWTKWAQAALEGKEKTTFAKFPFLQLVSLWRKKQVAREKTRSKI